MDLGRFVLAASTADLDDVPAAREHADAVEFRLDLAEEPLAALAAYDGDLPVIATDRVAWEGGESPDTPDRIDRLERALEGPSVEAVDLELAALTGEDTVSEARPDGATDASRVCDRAREAGVTVIASVHDFEGTPGRNRLEDLLRRACEAGDIGKLAVTAESRGDVLALLGATHAADRRGDRVATMAMGGPGRHSRAVAPVYGSRIGYAPVDPADATAPGQYDLATLAGLLGPLGVKRGGQG